MKTRDFFGKMRIEWVMAFVLLSSCLDPIYFNIPTPQFQTVINGYISTDPGPYIVKVSKAINILIDSSFSTPVEKAKIKLFDDAGNTEDFSETTAGVYKTGGVMQGQIGHAYHISVETADGKTFESEPDVMSPVGQVENIRFVYENRVLHQAYGDTQADIFNIYIDADAGEGDENYIRWRYTGTYKVVTNPELHYIWSEGFTLKDPYVCSGYVVAPALQGGNLIKVGECTCCTCWINKYETVPHLSNEQFAVGGKFKNIKVAEVPINNASFSDKFMVQIEQMSLSKQSLQFFNLIRIQKEGPSSLFQPPTGEINGNFHALNSSDQVVGLFWATSISSKRLFLNKSDVPYLVTPPDFDFSACTNFANSSNNQPKFWQ